MRLEDLDRLKNLYLEGINLKAELNKVDTLIDPADSGSKSFSVAIEGIEEGITLVIPGCDLTDTIKGILRDRKQQLIKEFEELSL